MIKVENLFCHFSIFYLLNYLWIERYFPAIGRLEIVNIIALIYLLSILLNIPYIISKGIDKLDFIVIILFLVIIFMGGLGWFLYNYQSFKSTLIDGFLFSRFLVVYIAISNLVSDHDKKKLKSFFILNLKYLIIINFFLLIFNIVFHVFPTLDIRFGVPSQELIYSHPTYLATISFLGWSIISGEKKSLYQLLSLILMLSTMRSKIIVLVSIYIFYNLITKNIKIPAIRSILSFLGVTLFTYITFGDIIYTKLINQESSVRSEIVIKAIKIASDHFPFGTGFATFGSYASFINYSPIYNIYGLSQSYGFLESSYQYGMDSYISMILAQFGFIGFVCFFIMLTVMFIKSITTVSFKQRRQIKLLALFLLMSCFTESIINTGLGVAIFSFFALSNIQERITEQ